jgi:selenocysteine-specific elongation factor
VADVQLVGDDSPPRTPLLHVGSAAQQVQFRALGGEYARIRLSDPLPLRFWDRALLRDPGSRNVWGVRVVDPGPPALDRRGAAAARARALADHDGSASSEVRLRGAVRRSDLRRRGFDLDRNPPGIVVDGDWLLTPEAARRRKHSTPARAVAASDPLARDVLARLHDHLLDRPFAAPDAETFTRIGLTDALAGQLHRNGHLLRLAPGVVLLPGAVERALELLSSLDQPFTTSQARRALDTSRRVILALLDHLDRHGHTVRLPDDRRRMRR